MATPTYLTYTDLLNLLSEKEQAQLSDDVAGGEVVDQAIVNTIIAYSEGFADAYVSARYTVPLDTPIPPVYEWAILAIAKMRLFQRKNWFSDDTQSEYDQAMAFLEMVRDGEAHLPIDESTDNTTFEFGLADTSNNGSLSFNDDDQPFGR